MQNVIKLSFVMLFYYAECRGASLTVKLCPTG
jgi:hypothetical protein